MRRTWRNWKVTLHRSVARKSSLREELKSGRIRERARRVCVRWLDSAGGTSRIWVTGPCINGRYEFFQGIFIGIEARRGIAVACRTEEIEYEPTERCAPTGLGYPREQRSELFYLAVRSRGNLRIVENGEDCHPSGVGKRAGVARPSSRLVDENRAIYPTAMPLRNNG